MWNLSLFPSSAVQVWIWCSGRKRPAQLPQSQALLWEERSKPLRQFCQHTSPFLFCAAGQAQAFRGFVKKTNVFSPVAYIRDFSRGLDRWEATDVATYLCDTALWELTSRPWHVRQRPSYSRDHAQSFQTVWHFMFEVWEVASCSQAQVSCLPADRIPAPGPDLAFCHRSFYLKAGLGKSTILTQATIWRQ